MSCCKEEIRSHDVPHLAYSEWHRTVQTRALQRKPCLATESVISRQFPAPMRFASAAKNCLAKDTSVPE